MRPKTSTLARLAAALLLLASARARAAEPVKIRIGWIVAVANWPSILMEKPGLARHAGKSYVLEPVRFQGTPTEITALANGELEIADLAFSSFALAVENAGMDDLRIIADEFQDGAPGYYTDEFFVLKDGPIRTVKDLKGKVLATNAAGSAVDIVMRAMLRRNGLDERKDVTFVEAAFPNMRAMLAESKVALIPGVVPFSLDPQLRAIARPLFTQKEAVGRTQMLVWTARAGFLEKHRAAVLDFLEDALRAVRFYLDPRNHDEVVQIAARVSKQPPDRFQEWLFTKKDYYRDPGLVPDLEALQANIDLARDLGLLKASLDVKKHADLSLVREAAGRLR
jgi:ABC-type nitrate/sulfonate/bicarbonate transport system substrate-binding protein